MGNCIFMSSNGYLILIFSLFFFLEDTSTLEEEESNNSSLTNAHFNSIDWSRYSKTLLCKRITPRMSDNAAQAILFLKSTSGD